MEKNNKAVLVDIDGTLVEVTPGWSPETNVAWEMDTVNANVLLKGIELIKQFKEEGYTLVFLTARGQGCRKYTKKKLKEIGVWHMVDSMWHRPLKWESVSSSVYKEHMIKMLMKKYDFEWAMDDEDKNLEMMERMGMKVLDAKSWW
jgi:hydroxymethylpyrimidine pyrophosphatase-like HAD family hydrolase